MDLNNSDFSKILEQAQKIKADFELKKQEFVKKQFHGSSGGGLVEVTLLGSGNFTNLRIDPKLKANAASDNTLEDLILAAVNVAHDSFKRESQNLFSGFSDMPGAAEFMSE